MHLKKTTQFLVFVTILAANLIKKSHGKKIILISQMLLIFISLNLTDQCYANDDIAYPNLIKKIQGGQTFGVQYNSLKSAAIVDLLNGIVIYINFNTKKTYTISNDWPGLVTATWLNEHIAHIQGSCGAGCAKSIIFVAPSTSISCSTHEFRIKNLNPNYPPDFQSNKPLLIDIKKGIYVCYDDENNIQVFPLPKYPTIHPPKNYYSEKAEIKNGKFIVIYENGRGKLKRVSYTPAQ